jgi:hypothetical protein
MAFEGIGAAELERTLKHGFFNRFTNFFYCGVCYPNPGTLHKKTTAHEHNSEG